ncbi:hypothetical protein Riv7116_4103 [Rivularia sp. PCC 7116]|uniref:hypothetical protein n=1 Tax=Rivularia sp. PCC 7116 TaxID=373994 RepID=UPI00029EC8AA|nr:hypothetical protein [Rivularia sp. PCC 7116]AFY56537.1 hypothetical protein Riv7116_4103 [Rivularia sp. PCC 7116]
MDNIFSRLSDNLSESFNSVTKGFNLTDTIEDLLPNIATVIPLTNAPQLFDEFVSSIDLVDLGGNILEFGGDILETLANPFVNNLEDIIGNNPTPQTSISDLITGLNTVSTFDLEADLTNEDNFYNLPYPNDLRLTPDGNPDLSGFPIPDNNIFAESIKSIADDSPGFPTNTAGYFRFNFPVATQDFDDVIAADTDSPILLIDIDPDSPNRGELLPTVASTFRPDVNYVPPFLLGVAPAPGIILNPNRTYAYVVKSSLDNAIGRPLNASPTLQQLIDGETPQGELGDEARELYQPLWETLDDIEVNPDDVAAATVFTTGDVVAEFAKLSDEIVERYDVTIENLQLAPEDGASNPRFYELQGTVTMPQFQEGTPPFDTEGLFEFDQNGFLIEQRTEEVPVTITIPKTPMPDGGYPLMAYFHGSSGLTTQLVDRGAITEPGGEPTPGEGPAFVVAEKGFAAVSSALPLNEQRFPDGSNTTYYNVQNLAAFRDTFRQTVIEQRLLLEAMEDLKIPSEVIGSQADVLLPDGKTDFGFQSSPVMAFGQSYGAQVANVIGAIEPKIGTVVSSGSPAYFALQAVENEEIASLGRLLVGTLQELNPIYPALNLVETAWGAVEPIVYMPHIAQRPLPGNPVRSIYQPVGKGDTIVSENVFNAQALAAGVEQAGEILWSEMQESLALQGLDGIVPYPVANNLVSENGTPYTGVVVQYEGDGIADSHGIFAQLDEVKEQYSEFFDSFQETGIAVVPAS